MKTFVQSITQIRFNRYQNLQSYFILDLLDNLTLIKCCGHSNLVQINQGKGDKDYTFLWLTVKCRITMTIQSSNMCKISYYCQIFIYRGKPTNSIK